MTTIPKQLQRPEFRFNKCGNSEDPKAPIEPDWQNTKNYPFNDLGLVSFVESGKPFGILGGYGNLIILDADSAEVNDVGKSLPETFTVKSSSPEIYKRHYYFILDKKIDPIRLHFTGEHPGSRGDVRSTGQYVVAPNSVLPNGKRYIVEKEIHITNITLAQLKKALAKYPFVAKGQIKETLELGEHKAPIRVNDPYVQNCNVPEYLKQHKLKENTSKNYVLFRYVADILRNRYEFKDANKVADNIVETQQHSKSAISGWMLKHDDQTLEESSCQKMKQYLRDYHPELEEDICGQCPLHKLAEQGKEAGQVPKKEASFKIKPALITDHLPFFEDLEILLQLYGSDYRIIKKFLYRQLVSVAISQDIIVVGGIYTDRRIHGLYVMGSGDGKRNIKSLSKTLLTELGKRVEEPSSIHSEQLIGKVIERIKKKGQNAQELYGDKLIADMGTRVLLMNKGWLNSDFLQLEEAAELFTSEERDMVECREKLCIGLDPIGKNEVTKRSVDNLENEKVRYCPKTTVQAFMQPLPLPEEIVLKGTIRRFSVPYAHLNSDDRNYSEKWQLKKDLTICKENFLSHLEKIQQATLQPFEFTLEAIKKMDLYHHFLVGYARSYSEKCNNFADRLDWTLQEFIIKYSVNTAAIMYTNIVDEKIVDLSFMDFMEIWHNYLNFIDKKVKGDLDYGEAYQGATFKQREVIDFLLDAEATSLETSKLSIQDLLSAMMSILGKPYDTVHYHYRKMIKEGLIKSQQIGQHDSRVWLNLEIVKKTQGYKGYQGYNAYNQIILNLQQRNKLDVLQPLYPSQPSAIISLESLNQQSTKVEGYKPLLVSLPTLNIVELTDENKKEIADFLITNLMQPDQEAIALKCSQKYGLPLEIIQEAQRRVCHAILA